MVWGSVAWAERVCSWPLGECTQGTRQLGLGSGPGRRGLEERGMGCQQSPGTVGSPTAQVAWLTLGGRGAMAAELDGAQRAAGPRGVLVLAHEFVEKQLLFQVKRG